MKKTLIQQSGQRIYTSLSRSIHLFGSAETYHGVRAKSKTKLAAARTISHGIDFLSCFLGGVWVFLVVSGFL